MRRTRALIVGGGPAGACAAIGLARAGREHLLLERTRETGDALCGGFLSWRTLESLSIVGVDADDLNRQRITRVTLFAGSRMREAALPRPALSVSRNRLDSMLIGRASDAGAAIERGVAVRAIQGLEARTADGTTIAGDALFLASGKHDVRGLARPSQAAGADPVLGLRVHLGPSPALAKLVGDRIELHLFDRGYAGLAMQEDGRVNLCMAVHRSRLTEAGSPRALLASLGAASPRLAERLAYLTPEPTIDATANVPYGWRLRAGAPHLYRLGDQAGVIPSLAGEGMGIAIASGITAAADYVRSDGAGADTWQRRFARRLARPIGVADIVRHLAEGPLGPALVTAARGPLIQFVAHATRIAQ